MGDWVIFKGNKFRTSDAGKVLVHLDKLRQDARRLRADLMELKDIARISTDYGLTNPYQDLINVLEKSIEASDSELESLRQGLHNALQSKPKPKKSKVIRVRL